MSIQLPMYYKLQWIDPEGFHQVESHLDLPGLITLASSLTHGCVEAEHVEVWDMTYDNPQKVYG